MKLDHLYVVDILKTNKLKVSDFFFPNWKSYRDLNLSGEALYAGLVWWEIKNYIRTYKYIHVRTVYLTQKSSVWTRTFLYLRFTRFSVYWSAPKLHNSKIRIEFSGNATATLEEAESYKETEKMPRRSKMTKKMKLMTEEAAAVRRLVVYEKVYEKSMGRFISLTSLLKQEKVEKACLQIRT